MENNDTMEKAVYVKTETKKKRMPRKNTKKEDGQTSRTNYENKLNEKKSKRSKERKEIQNEKKRE